MLNPLLVPGIPSQTDHLYHSVDPSRHELNTPQLNSPEKTNTPETRPFQSSRVLVYTFLVTDDTIPYMVGKFRPEPKYSVHGETHYLHVEARAGTSNNRTHLPCFFLLLLVWFIFFFFFFFLLSFVRQFLSFLRFFLRLFFFFFWKAGKF